MNYRQWKEYKARVVVQESATELKKKVRQAETRLELEQYIDDAVAITLRNPVVAQEKMRTEAGFQKLVEETRQTLIEYYQRFQGEKHA
jgi:hypothetical protein